MTGIIYHLVPIDYWEAQPTDRPYTPADFAREGFIHCTQGDEQIAVVANRYYRNDRRAVVGAGASTAAALTSETEVRAWGRWRVISAHLRAVES